MLFTIDRVQYAKKHQKYYFYEFMEVNNIYGLLDGNGKLLKPSLIWQAVYNMTTEVEKEKIEFLKSRNEYIRVFIFYQEGLNTFIKIELDPFNNKIFGDVWNFVELQDWFRKLNNIDGQNNSKGLGSARDSNVDSYVNGILQSIYNNNTFEDDNGLELTKQLLDKDTTKGFDLDLFQYVESTNEYVIYEFLKRENQYINNIQAHPMRYSWTNKWNDNKQKYISLWNVSQYLGARLLLINYSDNINEKISIIEITDLDINKGVTAEEKYCMSRNVFLGWLHDMNSYNSQNNNYLSDFIKVEYDQQFFDDFNVNKKKYGAEFSNIYI